jgi:Ca2+-binding EF-hand superfamily protein
MSYHDAFNPVDTSLDEIITIASSLKSKVGGVKEIFNQELVQRETNIKKVHGDLESLQQKLDSTSFAHKEDRDRLEQQIQQKEVEQQAKLKEYDQKVQNEFDARERAEREREAARGDAAAEKQRLGSLLKDLEEDASGYNRLRPSKPMLNDEDTAILRQLFLSSAVSGSGKFSFTDLKQVLAKYSDNIPEGPLKKLFIMVENDSKGRMSYITLVAVANDLAALVADFRKIDTNGNGTLSRKEFRDHFVKLGFDKKSVQDALFRYADEDESDDVGFSEYVHLGLCLLVLRILYAFADFDKSGQLSREEVKKCLDEAHIPENTRKKFDHQFSVVDVDDSKSLSYQEFVMLVLLMFHDD